MRRLAFLFLIVAGLAVAAASFGIEQASAKTFRWAADVDAASLDPYSRQETFQLSFLSNIYEPLVRRGRDYQLEPALATSWRQVAPLVWRFELRRNVRFQDGTPFTADDVVFSFARVMSDGSKLTASLATVRDVRKVDGNTIEIVTFAPDPILPAELSIWKIMSKVWCEAHDASQATDLLKNDDNYASTHANGTGPFVIAERTPNEQTVLVPNPNWWDKAEHNLDRVEFRRIADDGARVSALANGEVDMLYSVPRQGVDRLARIGGVQILHVPEFRTIFLGFDQFRKELSGGSIRGRNPFKDRRVREAFAAAIDEETIVAKVMRGLATPAGLLVGPGVTGFDPARNVRPAYDPAAAKRLLAAAGYPEGFALDMDCPNDRYVNDEAICQAVAANLDKIGIRVRLNVQSRALFFGQIFDPGIGSSFYLLGWTPANADAGNALLNLAATPSDVLHAGEYNIGGYSNTRLDALMSRVQYESDPKERAQLLGQALSIVHDDVAYIPLHQQDIVWAARDNVEVKPRGDGSFLLRYVRLK